MRLIARPAKIQIGNPVVRQDAECVQALGTEIDACARRRRRGEENGLCADERDVLFRQRVGEIGHGQSCINSNFRSSVRCNGEKLSSLTI